jgi:hypothetical protein
MSLILSGTDGLSDVDGTAATPAIRGTDANTGIFFPAADTIAFAEGGAEVARFDSSGNLGVGTTSPATKLDVNAGTTGRFRFTESSGTLLDHINGAASAFAASYQRAASYGWGIGSALPPTAMTLDASGNLLVGTTSANGKLTVNSGATTFVASLTSTGTNTYTPTASTSLVNSTLQLNGGNASGATTGIRISQSSSFELFFGGVQESGGAGAFVFQGYSGSGYAERARIDSSGNLLVGTTSSSVTNSNSVTVLPAFGQINYQHASGTSSGANYAYFAYNASGIGSITQNGTTAVAYNTTSDYRLKKNVQPLAGALSRIAALKPCTYTWESAPDEIGEGFIAHELQEVCPQAVTGEKDALNEDGSIKPQGIDTSFLVATLTAAIQEQQALITTLTARISALESA